MNRSLERQRRRGATMFELMLVISISSVLMSLVAVWLHKLMFFSNVLLERQRDHSALQRMAGDLRQDVQLATRWSFPKANELELILADDSKILYRVVAMPEGSQIQVRYGSTEQNDPSAATAQPSATRQETYRFSPNCKLIWEKDNFPETLSLVVYRQPLLANPLPDNRSSTSTSESQTSQQAATKQPETEVSNLIIESNQPIEAHLLLKLNRWRGQVKREWGETP